jgi:hypothetical protein
MRIRVHPTPTLACHQSWIMGEEMEMVLSGFLNIDESDKLMMTSAASKLTVPFATV